MRNRPLHQTLRAFIEEAALQLAHDAAEGEVPFDLVESRGLYCYRPLTADFIRSRLGALGRLPSYAAAAQQLEGLEGAAAYLRRRGEPRVPDAARDRADAVLRSFLCAVFDEVTEFEWAPDRFARAYDELEGTLYDGRARFVVVAPLLGLELGSDEVALGEGLSLVAGEAVAEDLPDEAWPLTEEDAVFAVLRAEGDVSEPPPVTAARTRFRRLLSALRLFDAGAYALGPAAWSRVDAGPWRMTPLGATVTRRPRSVTWVEPGQEDELRAFVNLVSRRSARGGPTAWALARYEMGCERPPLEGLTDHVLALRALLEPEGPESGRLARRLAAICAVPERRAALVDRTARALALERAVIAGLAGSEPGADALIAELGGHLRALLRDVLCGHLDPDLVGVAESLLADDKDAVEPEPHGELEPATENGPAGAPLASGQSGPAPPRRRGTATLG